MSTANDLLDRLAEVGAKVEAAGNRLIVRTGPKPVPGELVHRLREAKAEVLAVLAQLGANLPRPKRFTGATRGRPPGGVGIS